MVRTASEMKQQYPKLYAVVYTRGWLAGATGESVASNQQRSIEAREVWLIGHRASQASARHLTSKDSPS